MAPTFSPHLALQIDKSSQMLPIRGRAPIVVSELDLEFDSAQQRDDLEELNDFTSLLIPAARKSAARRLGALKSPMARRVQEGPKQRHSQRNSVPAANKFPVIDEDLLMLATQRVSVGGCSAIPPPNLCRLITNVSEARWTSKRPLGHSSKANLERERKERPKSVGHLPIPRGANNGQPHKEQQQNMLRKKRLELSRVNKCQNNGTANGVKRNDEAALRRLSALSVVSSYTTNMEEAANCDCTSLALAAFRSNWVAGMRRKKWQQAKQRPRGEGDDAYRKMSPPPTAMRDSSTNDSGISSSSCSSESSRSASLADAFHHQCHLLNLPTQTSGPNCLRCSAKMNLPPKSLADEKKGTTHQSLQGRRRHWLALLLGNMLKMMDKEKPSEVRERRQYDKRTTGEDTKLTKESNATEPSRNGKLNVPQINVQMVEEEEEEGAKVNEKCQKINDGGGKRHPSDGISKGKRRKKKRKC